MDIDTLNKIRRDAEITCTEFADFVGASRGYMVRVELGLEPTQDWMVAALNKMIAARAA